MNEILKEIGSLDNVNVDIGQFGSGGSPEDDIAARAAVNELGTRDGRIPARPFHGQTFDRNVKDTQKLVSKLYGKLVDRKIRAKKMVNAVGGFYLARMKEIFTTGSFEPNAESTIIRKKSSRPLIDEGEMRRRTEFKVTQA